jgi:hypothetical protein
MLRAVGSFEYLCDHLLLTWRISDNPAEQFALAWFLREGVPKAGFLPNLALDEFEGRRTA